MADRKLCVMRAEAECTPMPSYRLLAYCRPSRAVEKDGDVAGFGGAGADERPPRHIAALAGTALTARAPAQAGADAMGRWPPISLAAAPPILVEGQPRAARHRCDSPPHAGIPARWRGDAAAQVLR